MGDNNFRNKRGQVTIFIIVAIILVAIGVLVYMFAPDLKSTILGEEKTPQSYIQNCLEEDLEKIVFDVSQNGGSLTPNHYYSYNGNNVEYLCYTKEDLQQCSVTRPALTSHIQSEIEKGISQKVASCFESLKADYEKKSYTVNIRNGPISVELLPNRINLIANNSVRMSKEDNNEEYENFNIVLNNNLYELTIIANSIVLSETNYGDSDPTLFMDFYRNLKIEKKKQSEGTTIYIITERDSKNKFQFASRSMAWVPGFQQ